MAKGRVTVREEFCKSCELCIVACPMKVLRISEHINPKGHRPVEQFKEGCTGCALCAYACPDVVLAVYRQDA